MTPTKTAVDQAEETPAQSVEEPPQAPESPGESATAQTPPEPANAGEADTEPPEEAGEQPDGQVVPHQPPAVPEMPTVPTWSDWQAIETMAEALSKANIAPKGLKGNAANFKLVLLTGRDLGIPITSALREVYVIENQTSISPRLKQGRVRMLGLGKIVPDPLVEQRPDRATALALLTERCQVCTNAGGWIIREGDPPMACPACHTTGFKPAGPAITFDWDDAKRGGMISTNTNIEGVPQDAQCTAEDHLTCRYTVQEDGKTKVKHRCKDNWIHFPRHMHWWRASGQAVDIYFPEAALGLLTPDELGAITDMHGEVIEAESWATAREGEDDRPDPEEVKALHQSVAQMDAETRRGMLERWRQGQVPPVTLDQMNLTEFRRARSIHAAYERELSRKVKTRPDGTAPTHADAQAKAEPPALPAPKEPGIPEPGTETEEPTAAGWCSQCKRVTEWTDDGRCESCGKEYDPDTDEEPAAATNAEPPAETTQTPAAPAAQTEDEVDAVIAKVQAMTEDEVDAALTRRGKVPGKKNEATRRRELAALMIHEAGERRQRGTEEF